MRFILQSFFLALVIALPINSAFSAVPTSVGSVKYMRGHVVAVRNNVEVGLKKGDPVYEGDVLKTGKRSSLFALMKGDKANSIRMGQKSQLKIEKYKLSAGEVVGGFLRGLIGIFTVELNNLRHGSDFTMKTPTAVLGVRGTIWGSVVKADGTTTFAVKRGSVSVRKGKVTVRLSKGQVVSVSTKGGFTPVKATPKTLTNAFDSGGEDFDNAVEERAAAAAAAAEADAAVDALAAAAVEAEAAAQAAEDAAAVAEANPDDVEAQKKAEELAKEAEMAVEGVVDAAEKSTVARDELVQAEMLLQAADSGVPVTTPQPSSNNNNATTPNGSQGNKKDKPNDTVQPETTPAAVIVPTTTTTGGGAAASGG